MLTGAVASAALVVRALVWRERPPRLMALHVAALGRRRRFTSWFGWFGLVGPAVAAMAIAMYVNDDPNATVGNAIAMTILGLAFAMLAVRCTCPPSAPSAARGQSRRRRPTHVAAKGRAQHGRPVSPSDCRIGLR
jgi:hypothetical protein